MMYEPKALGAAADPMAMYRAFLQSRAQGGGGGGLLQAPAMPMAQQPQQQGLLGGDQNLGSLLSLLRQNQGGGLLGQAANLQNTPGAYSPQAASMLGYQGYGPFLGGV